MSLQIAAVVLTVSASAAQGQAPAAGALGAAAQPKVAAPAAAATVAAGSGSSADPAERAAALKAAIERCDLAGTLALGGGPDDAARIVVAVNRNRPIVAGSAAWVQSAGRVALAARSETGNPTILAGANLLGDFAPPGGAASLPTVTQAFGSGQSPTFNPTPENMDLGKRAVGGMTAKEAATALLALPPAKPQYSDLAQDPDQAWFSHYTANGATLVALNIPQFNTQGQRGATLTPLAGTEAIFDRADVLQQPPQLQIPAWIKDLPPSPPPPPPATTC